MPEPTPKPTRKEINALRVPIHPKIPKPQTPFGDRALCIAAKMRQHPIAPPKSLTTLV